MKKVWFQSRLILGTAALLYGCGEPQSPPAAALAPIPDGSTIEGLGVVHPDGTNIIVDALIPINKDTVDGLAQSG